MTINVNKSQVTIEVLQGFNFKIWNENLRFSFVIIEIDIILHVPKPTAIIAESTLDHKLFYEKWDKGKSHVSLCD